MKVKNLWPFCLLLPVKFYGGGGGGSQIVNQDNPQQRALANVANQKWQYYQQKYVPLENQWMNQVANMDSQGNHDTAAGMAATTLKQANGPQTGNVGASMGGQRLGMGDYLPEAASEANATNTANQGVTNRMLQGEQGIVAMGQGQSTGAIQGLSSVAQQSVTGQQQNAGNAFEQQQNNLAIPGTVAGMGMAALTNKYINQNARA